MLSLPRPPPALGRGNPQSERHVVASAVQKAIEAKTLKTSRVIGSLLHRRQSRILAADGANALAGIYIGDQLALKADAVRRANDWLDPRVGDLAPSRSRPCEDRMAPCHRAHVRACRGRAGRVLSDGRISRLTADSCRRATASLAAAEARLLPARAATGPPGRRRRSPRASWPCARSRTSFPDSCIRPWRGSARTIRPWPPCAVRSPTSSARSKRRRAAWLPLWKPKSDDRAKVAALEDSGKAAKGQVDQKAQAQIPLNAMQRDVEAERGLLRSVLDRMQGTAQQAALEMPDARIISPALLPEKPSAAKDAAADGRCGRVRRLLRPAACLCAGNERRHFPQRRGCALDVRLALLRAGAGGIRRAALRRCRVEDYPAEKPLSPFSEQLRALRAALWLGRENPRVIAITAARPAEGKTTIAVGLGRSAAISGERVIVLDCDVRQPSFGRLMQADGALGIADFLLGHATLKQVVQRIPHRHGLHSGGLGRDELDGDVHV